MSIDFSPANHRAASSDLTVSISPLGLVELADEEFEVHGPRLNRYSLNWAMYLGHHYSFRRASGESQMAYNYFRAFTDYLINFTFGQGVQFSSPKETEAIIPDLLKRVWEVDNNKQNVMWEIGQQGSVSGDCFIKVAYEEPYEDTIGRFHPGRVRILPLNSSFCFPEFHPHDRDRLIRFKLKYRFWGTALEGTRQVMTYTEILTEDRIEEYINDELIDSRENPMGIIPVVHIPNTRISGSPWGLSDCNDIISLNRNFNEVSTDVADIINYHAAPVTIVSGAKASTLEKGANKVWGGIPKDAKVYNLEGGGSGLQGAMQYLENLKRSMHEMVGVPESALGQMQPISNTSGVALSIMYQPLMNKWRQKTALYSKGLERVNELIILLMAIKEPHMLMWQETDPVALREGQYPVLDPNDPLTYRSEAHFPPPLPFDKLVVLNEIQAKMAMGLESKEGALRALGEEYPDEKMTEIRTALVEEAKADGALDLIKAQIQLATMFMTGADPLGPDGEPDTGDEDATEGGGMGIPPAGMMAIQQMMNELVTRAYGTKAAQSSMAQGGEE